MIGHGGGLDGGEAKLAGVRLQWDTQHHWTILCLPVRGVWWGRWWGRDEGWWVVSSWDRHDVQHHIWAWISGHTWAWVLGGLGVAGIVGAGLLQQPQCQVSTVEDQVKSIILSTRTEESKGWTISQESVIQMALARVLQISKGECLRKNQELKRCKEGWLRLMSGKVYLPKML